MSEEMQMVADLGLILISAGVFTIISKALKQPLILGYIIAGFIVGPHMGLFPTVTSTETVSQWSEIGIIFLLFALGLEFSFKKLVKIGSSALITAGTKCIGMFLVGFIAGEIMGWTPMEKLFLGGLLSMSSTTIIIKAYDDMGLKKKPYATLIFGSLVFEDLIAVLLMVLLSTVAVSNKFAGGEILMSVAKLVFFLILWFVVGIYLIPLLLKWAKKFLSDEILLLISIGMCFGMVWLATLAGFSSALGAFVMGSILAETVEGERIEHLLGGIKDLFGAIFFVSVGMMVDPGVIAQHWLPILIVTVAAMSGILIFSTSGALLAGQGLDTAVHAGFSLSQLGEFAFIIAGLGCSLGVMRDFIYPVIIAVSVITTFTTPYMIKAADPVSRWLQRVLPASLLARLTPAEEKKEAPSTAESREWKSLLKGTVIRILIYGVILIAVERGAGLFLGKAVDALLPDITEGLKKAICVVSTLVVMTPFIIALNLPGASAKASTRKLLHKNKAYGWPIQAAILLKAAISTFFVIRVFLDFLSLKLWAIMLIIAAVAAAIILARKFFGDRAIFEDTFMTNFNEKEEMMRRAAPVATAMKDKMQGYDVHIEKFDVVPESRYVGLTMRELPFRKDHDVNIVKIVRGSKSIVIPAGNERIFPGDELLAVGTGAQLKKFRESMEGEYLLPPEEAASEPQEFSVETITVREGSYLEGKTLRDTKMKAYGCMIISVMRGDKFTTNPSADFHFQTGDVVWIAGEKNSCLWFA